MSYSPAIEKILQLAPLGPGHPFELLEKGKPVPDGHQAVARSPLPSLVQSALYLYLDCFDEAHEIANQQEGTWAGNWLHAIVHRREPDAGNSKYWYARVKAPDLYSALGHEAVALLGAVPPKAIEKIAHRMTKSGCWEPAIFVDLCEKIRRESPDSPPYRALARLQELEWKTLLTALLKGAEG